MFWAVLDAGFRVNDPAFQSEENYGWCGTCSLEEENATQFPEGEKLFKAKCTVCHKLNKKLIGPALVGATERNSMEWLMRFTRDSQSMIEAGDPYAVALYEEYNRTQMPSFPDLTDEEIMQIYGYIDGWTPPHPVYLP